MSAQTILLKYIAFFEARGHKRIPNSPLVPENDPTTLFTSAGMQPLIPYLLGEKHPAGKRLVNVQNSFRAQDIDEVGDNRHTTFFRMLGNWSLGDYFKKEEIPWLWEFLTRELGLPKDKLYITVFKGDENVPYDQEAEDIWRKVFAKEGVTPKIYAGDVSKNWWSRSGTPDKMPVGEIGGGDTEVYYRFDDVEHKKECKDNPVECECGKFVEIANSVFIQYQKTEEGFKELSQKNVDFGGGLERLLQAVDGKSDMFQTSLFAPIISAVEEATKKNYLNESASMQIVSDHFAAAVFLTSAGVKPSNKEQGYVLRRLIRRGHDHFSRLGGENIEPILETIVEQYRHTDSELKENYEEIKNTILQEETGYRKTLSEAKKLIEKELAKTGVKTGDEIKGSVEISAELAFKSLATYGLGPTQLKSLGYTFNDQELAEKMEEHQKISKAGASKKFAGGLADAQEQTIRGHTATHLMHQAIRDMLGTEVHQKGSNITAERVRFDFNYGENLSDEQIKLLEETVNKKIEENLPVYFEFMPLSEAKKIGAIGLFDEKYEENVKIYLIGSRNPDEAYSKEFCGGPHVNFTSEIKSFKIIKQENIGAGIRRLYVKVGDLS
jgi:alanyl-tRNA synthetase